MLRRLTLATVVVAPLALAIPHTASAATVLDQGGGAAECTIAISMQPVTPGVSYVPGQATYKMSGFTDCMSTDTQLTHGTLTGTGGGIVGCIGGFRTADITIAWNNGQTSTEHLQFGEFLYGGGAEGTVTGGEFDGSMVGMALERRTGGGEVRCVTGVQSYGMAGEMGIFGSGGPGSGGGGGGGAGGPSSGGPSGGTGSNGGAGVAAARTNAAAVTPGTGAVKVSASTPTTGTTLSPSIPTTGLGAGVLTGITLLSLGAAFLTRTALL